MLGNIPVWLTTAAILAVVAVGAKEFAAWPSTVNQLLSIILGLISAYEGDGGS